LRDKREPAVLERVCRSLSVSEVARGGGLRIVIGSSAALTWVARGDGGGRRNRPVEAAEDQLTQLLA
jgi:hypothetical protein